MRELARAAAVLSIVAGGLVVASLALRAGDRELLTAPPEAVAESFFRSVTEERYPQAAELCADPPPSERELHTYRLKQVERTGQVEDISADQESIADDQAVATVNLRGSKRSEDVRMRLAFKKGVWRVEFDSLE